MIDNAGPTGLKFLLDTNILIPSEPTSKEDIEEGTRKAAQLLKGLAEGKHEVFVHRASQLDINRDKDETRRNLRTIALQKYQHIPDPPKVSDVLKKKIGDPEQGSNDWVDNQLLAALHANAVTFLVTEDQRLTRKARRLGLERRIFSIAEAVAYLYELLPISPAPPPAVIQTVAHAVDIHDPILSSFRDDYSDFDKWFAKCQREHRITWTIKGDGDYLAAMTIVNAEESVRDLVLGKVLKICSFKVSDDYNGFLYSELLMRAIFEYAIKNSFEWLYVTVFPKYSLLIQRLEDLGFCSIEDAIETGEKTLVKSMVNSTATQESLHPLEFHRLFGPYHVSPSEIPWFIVPIRPEYCERLFPETMLQTDFLVGQNSCGNAIRKAYLCNASIRKIVPGAVLLFCRSQIDQRILGAGIVESATVSQSAEEIARIVAKRTVYDFEEIQRLSESEVLAILFRQILGRSLDLSLDELKREEIVGNVPQSIIEIRGEQKLWLRERLGI